MNFEFTKMIRNIEAELSSAYTPGAIKWCDENYDNAWTNAVDRFDAVLVRAMESGDYSLVNGESVIYLDTLLRLIAKYKAHKGMNGVKSFINNLRKSYA